MTFPACGGSARLKLGSGGAPATGQIAWPPAIALVAGTVPGAQFGGSMSKKIDARYLRIVIAVIIAVTGIKTWQQVATV